MVEVVSMSEARAPNSTALTVLMAAWQGKGREPRSWKKKEEEQDTGNDIVRRLAC